MLSKALLATALLWAAPLSAAPLSSDFGSGASSFEAAGKKIMARAPKKRALGPHRFGATLNVSPIVTCQSLYNTTIVANGRGAITGPVLNTALSCPLTAILPLTGTFNGATWQPSIPAGYISAQMIGGLPPPSLTVLGGVLAGAAPAHQFLTSIGSNGALTFRQPSAADVSGLAASATTDTTNASNINRGTLNGALLPIPTTSVLGGILAATAPAHQYQTGNQAGSPTFAQPSAGDISGLASSATTDTTNAANILSGTLSGARLPVPTSSILGGILAASAPAHQFQTGNNAGSPTFAQPQFTDIAGSLANAQLPNSIAIPGTFSAVQPTGAPSTSFSAVGLFGNSAVTASAIYSPQVPPGWFTVDGVQSVVFVPSNSTATNTDAFAFYVRNQLASGGLGQNAVGLYGTITCEVNGCASWGWNPTLIDAASQSPGGSATGRKLIGGEIDFSPQYTTTIVQGIALRGSATVQPAGADGFTCGSMGGPAIWTHCFVVDDGTTATGLYLGSTTATGTPNGPSAPIMMAYYNANSTTSSPSGSAIQIQAVLGGINVSDVNKANMLSFFPSVAGVSPTIEANGTDTNININFQAKGTGSLNFTSPITIAANQYVSSAAPIISTNNLTAIPVATTSPQFQLTGNQSSGAAEADFWNQDTSATTSFRFNQITGSGTFVTPLAITPTAVSVSGNLAVASPGTFASGAQGVTASVIVNGLLPSVAYPPEAGGNFSNDALSVTMAVPANSTPSTAPFQNNGIASYVSAASAPGTSNGTPGGTVSGYFLAFAAGNGANLFGINPVCDDRNQSNVTCQNEFDIVVRNTSTNVNGIDVKISGSNNPANGSGVLIANAGTTAVHYPYGFTTTDGAALVGLRLGSQAGLAGVGATSISQVALLRSYDATSPNPVLHVAKYYSDQNGQFIFQSGQAGQAITFQDYSAANGTSGTTFFSASTAGYTMPDFTSAGLLTTTSAGALGSLSGPVGSVLAGQGSGVAPAFTGSPSITSMTLANYLYFNTAGGNIVSTYSGTGIINVDFTGSGSTNGSIFRFFRSTTGAASTAVQILAANNSASIQDNFEADGSSYMQALAGGLTVGSAVAIAGAPELGVAGTFGTTGAATIGGSLTAASYTVGSTAGVSCSGSPSTSYATNNGIVTHC